MKKVKPLILITRPLNGIIAFIATLLGAYFAGHTINKISIIAGIIVFLISASGNILNDIVDREIDKINRPKKPIPSGSISVKTALWEWIIFSAAGIIISITIGIPYFIIAISVWILLTTYSLILKGIPLIGNITVSLCTALTIPFGAISTGNPINVIFPSIFVFLIHFGREILKDGEDIIGDKKANLQTFPLIFGLIKAKALAIILLSLLIISTIIAYPIYGKVYLICVALTVDIPLITMFFTLKPDRKSFGKNERILKILMLTGIMSLITAYL